MGLGKRLKDILKKKNITVQRLSLSLIHIWIPENIVTLCTGFGPGRCHDRYDNGTREEREAMGRRIRAYLQSQYPDWDESRLIYKKGDSDG